MANRHIDILKEKQRKQKIVAAVLGVVFLGIVAFQGPKVWKQLHPAAPQASPTSAETTTTTAGTPTLAAPTLGGGETPSSATNDGSLAATTTPAVADGQLSSFSRFASKDPFAQQLKDGSNGSPSSSAAGSSSPRSSASGGGGTNGGGTNTGETKSGGMSPSRGSVSAPTPGTAVISVNGTLYSVAVGTDFPQASTADPSVVPLFHLVSATAHTVKISIAGGSYANGSATVTLHENKPVTLMNTADRTRYKLILKPAGTEVAAPSAPTSTPSTTVAVPPPSSP